MGAGAGEVAAHDVADGVAAGFTGGEADRGELSHGIRNALEGDVVHLDVLAGGDVAPAAGVLVGQVGEEVHLFGRDAAVGDLHPEHLVVAALALAVDPVGETENAEHVFFDVTGQVASQDTLKLLDVGGLAWIDLSLEHGNAFR